VADLDLAAASHAKRPFLVDAQTGRTLSYADFRLVVLDLAAGLARAGAARGTRIALLLPNGLELACAYFACLRLGAVAVPVNAKYAPADREYILGVSRAVLAVVPAAGAEAAGDAERARLPVFRVGTDPAGEPTDWELPDTAPTVPADAPPPNQAPDAPFALTFTSGTTGRPKGIFHSAATLLGNARAFNQALSITPEHRFLHAMPMAYMAGLLNCLLCPFAAGASVVVDREFDARMAFSFWPGVLRHGVNCLWSAPSALGMILALDRGEDGRRTALRFIAACTASLPGQLRAEFEERYGVPVLPSFGMSETLINTVDSLERRCPDGATGYPLPGMELRVVGPDGLAGAALAPGAEGELLVRSPSLMLGYLDPDTGGLQPASPSMPTAGWFPTGDMGMLLPGGALRITDRKKDLIVRGGMNVSPKKVEVALEGHAGVLEAAVVGLPDLARGERVAAAVRLRPGPGAASAESLRGELLARCRELLEPAAWPEALVFLADFPRGGTGKVDKRALRALLEGTC